MAQPQPEEHITLDKILRLVDQLSSDELLELRRQLDSKTWGERFRLLVQDVAADNADSPPLTDEEIVDEIMAHRMHLPTN